MADKKQFDQAGGDPSDLDPFAELTRIMGFDPREPVAPKAKAAPVSEESFLETLNNLDDAPAEPVSQAAADQMARNLQAEFVPADDLADDFGIDLERELLGDLLADAGTEHAVASPQPLAEAVSAVDDHFDAGFAEEAEELEAAFAGEVSDDEIDTDFDELNAAFADAEVEAAASGSAAIPADAATELPQTAQPEMLSAGELNLDELDLDDLDFGDIEAAIGREVDQSIQAATVAREAVQVAPDPDLTADLEDAFAHEDDAPVVASATVRTVPEALKPAAMAGELAAVDMDFDSDVDWTELDAKPSEAKLAPVVPAAKSAFELEAEELIAALDAAAANTTFDPPGLAGEQPAASNPEQVSALAKMADRYQSRDIHDTWRQTARPQQARAPAPEVETTEMFDQAYSMADDLDLPEIAYDEPATAPSAIDLEFDNLLNEMSRGDAPKPRPVAASAFDAPVFEPRTPVAARTEQKADDFGFDLVFAQGEIDDQPPHQDLGEFDFDEDGYEQEEPLAPPAYRGNARGNGGRGMMIAAIVGGIAVLGGLGAVAMSWGDNPGGAPVVLKADATPVKVRPENPGGTTVAHRDSTVYDAVAGEAERPTQERLVSATEEPMALPQPDDTEADDVASIVKGEDRVEPGQVDESVQEPIAVTPRKVRTVIVKPDGTLAPAPETAAAKAPKAVAAPVADEEVASIEQEPEQITTGATTATPDKPEPIAAAPGGWAVQVASQPSEDGANQSLRNISKRYSKVIGDRGSNIVKAEVAGKGTYWRVRIAAASRDDAVNLCSNLKSAGGSCFVTR